jgi:uncharacterized protein YjbI with pentapeptide repeats
MKIEIKNRFTGSVIFKLDVENNSISLTLKAAIKAKADLSDADLSRANLSDADLSDANLSRADLSDANLSDADLSRANLSDADLSDADLSHADLSDANLSDADLSRADLSDADLSRADLSDADLSHADLSDANLSDAIGNKKELRTMQIDTYSIAFTNSILQIGCKRFTHKEWGIFSDDEISKMDNGALEWWEKWKDFIFKAIELSDL